MQGEDATDERGCWSASTGSPVRRCTSVDNSMPECSRVVESPVKSTATCMSAPSALQCSNTSSDGKTRRYVRSNVPRLNWTDDLRRCFIRAIEELGGPQSEKINLLKSSSGTRIGLDSLSGVTMMTRCSSWDLPNNEPNFMESLA